MPRNQLSPLQEELLNAFFRRERRFFLTGGAALAGFHLGHRRTADLDLFTTPKSAGPDANTLDEADEALRNAAAEIGATVENTRTNPTHRQRLVKRGSDRLKVDLVVDEATQGYPHKMTIGDVLVDPPEEILANKLCTLLSRSEPRDLVDVHALERKGYRVEDALPLAARKDGSATPAEIAWVLEQIEIGEDAVLPGNVPAREIRAYLEDLIARLTRLAYPAGKNSPS
ncbi:nucleotidyl transferase AbiEii/AbiGii toxin family protein [Polyangium fumosum]|uniref:Nucleotidyl transferase AbiEii/AbiGii toxin family protein n=1 Tax=Polyangium fumosum TaxID=889272 RepID=A0A4U1IZ33_9BACT|nr:nucleotidyl transferase AbiEii/AbiGii toxin family protein [Polyangium fumosum]TKC99887.1 hypothetical protein E8A74_36350 [Polyangium fumosum]